MACRKRIEEPSLTWWSQTVDGWASRAALRRSSIAITGRLNYPMLAVTTVADGERAGCLVGLETGDDVDKFAHCRWHPGPLGMPIIDQCGRWFVGRILERATLGDDVAFVLDPIAAADDGVSENLTFAQVKHLEPGHDA
jgi:hypothetical protein